ncbi:MAG: DUF2851 family protein [Bacteroidota bacterium]|nr:DUF2851 family protein [Bacteroidota bacterium]
MREDLLRHIWSKKLFDESRIATTDGKPIRIFNSGTITTSGGPDFRNAKIEIGRTVFTGDIEFHRTFEDWNAHHHHHDPKYNSVILHVVLNGDAHATPSHSGRYIATVVLEPALLHPINALADQLMREEYTSQSGLIKCSSLNDSIDATLLQEWIRMMYRERLQEKVFRLHERLCSIIVTQQRIIGEPHPPYNDTLDDFPLPDATLDMHLFKQKIGWEQLLYEELLDGLGYSNNRKPFRTLADYISLITLKDLSAQRELSSVEIQAILFKVSGLLPALGSLEDQQSKIQIHQLHTAWNGLPKKISLTPIHSTEWNFSPTRPSNFPTIRIAAASVLLHQLLCNSLFKYIITIVEGKFSSPQSKIEQLLKALDVGDDPFWNFHYSFSEATHKKHTLLGDSRKFDIIVNTMIPFVALYAKVFGKNELADHCLNIAVELPLLEDNAVLRIMHKHLVKGKINIEFAYQQQGLIQLNKKYCVVERCGECEIGKKVLQ